MGICPRKETRDFIVLGIGQFRETGDLLIQELNSKKKGISSTESSITAAHEQCHTLHHFLHLCGNRNFKAIYFFKWKPFILFGSVCV